MPDRVPGSKAVAMLPFSLDRSDCRHSFRRTVYPEKGILFFAIFVKKIENFFWRYLKTTIFAIPKTTHPQRKTFKGQVLRRMDR